MVRGLDFRGAVLFGSAAPKACSEQAEKACRPAAILDRHLRSLRSKEWAAGRTVLAWTREPAEFAAVATSVINVKEAREGWNEQGKGETQRA